LTFFSMMELLDVACSVRCIRVPSCDDTMILNMTGIGSGCDGGCFNCT
jgi:hypothetical protein